MTIPVDHGGCGQQQGLWCSWPFFYVRFLMVMLDTWSWWSGGVVALVRTAGFAWFDSAGRFLLQSTMQLDSLAGSFVSAFLPMLEKTTEICPVWDAIPCA
jgi:hypothetical protein